MACCAVDPTQGDHLSLKVSRSDLALIAASMNPQHQQLNKGDLKAMLHRKLQYEADKYDIEAQYPHVQLQGYHENGSHRVRFCTWRVIPLCIVIIAMFSMGGILVATLGFKEPIPKKGLTTVSIILSCFYFFFLLGIAYLWNEKNNNKLFGKIRDEHSLLANIGKVLRPVYVCLGFPEPKTTHYIVLEPRKGHTPRTHAQERLSIHHPEPDVERDPPRSRWPAHVLNQNLRTEEHELDGQPLSHNQRTASKARRNDGSVLNGELPVRPPPLRAGRSRLDDHGGTMPRRAVPHQDSVRNGSCSAVPGNYYLAQLPEVLGQVTLDEIFANDALERLIKHQAPTAREYPPDPGMGTPDSASIEEDATTFQSKVKGVNVRYAANRHTKNEHEASPKGEDSIPRADNMDPDTGDAPRYKPPLQNVHEHLARRVRRKSPLTDNIYGASRTTRRVRRASCRRPNRVYIPVPVRSSSLGFRKTCGHSPARSVSPAAFSTVPDPHDSGCTYSSEIDDVSLFTAANRTVSSLSNAQETSQK